jgi:guanosine-3',5'-bis(diphosphate) 3'-pyrophosphohydrolase
MKQIDTELERQEIIKRYRQLLRVSKWSREKGDIKVIRAAFDLAVESHKDMRRKSGEPYIYHPIAVARIAAEEMGLGTTSIVCALLHDVVEDTDISLQHIEKQFGNKVARIIDGLTKISGVFGHQSSPQAENFRKMLLTLSDDVRVILIKLCDRLHNMRTLQHMSRKGQLKIASETLYLYAPLAHRLGLYAIKTELEDLSLKYTETEQYQKIRQKLNASKEQRNRYIRSFIAPVKRELEQLGLPIEIKGRPKSIYSIHHKMEKQGIPFEQVYDLFAIRIIIDSKPEHEKKDCWAAYSVITSIYPPNPDRLRDWISLPRSNGYESLHITVMGPKGKWVEVQIRTNRMDEIAERGYAAHWKYKENTDEESGLDQWLTRVREILESQESDALDFLDEFKLNLFAEEVYVFTPKGDLKKLPNGASALDFAFEIHTDVGATCLGAKVNGKLVPLSYTLHNGDQIEILTSSKQKPTKDWLNMVKTAKAKSKINQMLKEEKRRIAADGKELLQRKFRNAKVPFSVENLHILYDHFRLGSEQELYYQLAIGNIKTEDLKIKEVVQNHSLKRGPSKGKGASEELAKKYRNDDIIVGDADIELDYSFAKCCSPIPGDPIVGFVTVGEGIKIHKTSCKNAVRLMSNYGYRIIKVRWAQEPDTKEPFLASILITGIDTVGLVSKITDIISKEFQVNMRSISFSALDGTFEGKLDLYVSSLEHLTNVMDKIKRIDKYINVSRVEVLDGE